MTTLNEKQNEFREELKKIMPSGAEAATLALAALRQLQDHYEKQANPYMSAAEHLHNGRKTMDDHKQWTIRDERRYLRSIGMYGEITKSLVLFHGCRHTYALKLLQKYRTATLQYRKIWDLPFTREEAIAEINSARSWHGQQIR